MTRLLFGGSKVHWGRNRRARPPDHSSMHSPARFILGLARDLFDLVAPYRCAGCDVPSPTAPPLCPRCRDALEGPEDPPADVRVPYAWVGPLGLAIARAKYGSYPALAASLGSLLVPAVGDLRGEIHRVVPVPLHPARLTTRGYNQSMELSRAVARSLMVPLSPMSLHRVRDTPSQRTLGRADREANVRDAFAVAQGQTLRGLRVLLIDDVVTTGATLYAARAPLLASGATVVCLALAHAPRMSASVG